MTPGQRSSFQPSGGASQPITERTAGITKMAPQGENPTAISVVYPKLLMIGNVARQSAENPQKVARPETVMAVPIFWTLS